MSNNHHPDVRLQKEEQAISLSSYPPAQKTLIVWLEDYSCKNKFQCPVHHQRWAAICKCKCRTEMRRGWPTRVKSFVGLLSSQSNNECKIWVNGIPWVIFGTETDIYVDENLNNLNGMDIFIRFVHRKWVLLELKALSGGRPHDVTSHWTLLSLRICKDGMDNAPLLAPSVIKIHSVWSSFSVHHIIIITIMRCDDARVMDMHKISSTHTG